MLHQLQLLGRGLIARIDLQRARELIRRALHVARLPQHAPAIQMLIRRLKPQTLIARLVTQVRRLLQVRLPKRFKRRVVIIASLSLLAPLIPRARRLRMRRRRRERQCHRKRKRASDKESTAQNVLESPTESRLLLHAFRPLDIAANAGPVGRSAGFRPAP